MFTVEKNDLVAVSELFQDIGGFALEWVHPRKPLAYHPLSKNLVELGVEITEKDRKSLREKIHKQTDDILAKISGPDFFAYRDEEQQNFLHHAAYNGKTDFLEQILKALSLKPAPKPTFFERMLWYPWQGLNAQNIFGETALQLAVAEGNSAIVTKLLFYGAEQIPDAHGHTPLHMAMALGQLKCIPLLLKYDANPAAKNAAGLIPRDLALEHRKFDAVSIFDSYISAQEVARSFLPHRKLHRQTSSASDEGISSATSSISDDFDGHACTMSRSRKPCK